ncbi:MAG: tpx [Gammaproteobacteria bacterium]|jgi:thiol peroxidase|nr:tpx [Gammaproteobacteria bacterium]
MATVTLQGKPQQTVGDLPKLGSQAPDFILTKTDLSEVSLADYAGKKILLSIFPSVDTGTCAAAMRHFNEKASKIGDAIVLCISADLPFAQKRFCAAENLNNVMPVSIFRHSDFGRKYGVLLSTGPLAGLLSRAVVVINEQAKVVYTQLVPEISAEPNYEIALAALR